jgi:GMP synthase (glutamine-hydrolysing)
VQILSVIHGIDARTELFAPAIAESGHAFDEWSFGSGTPPPRPLDTYDAVFVFGGAMHADQDEHHPWLADEVAWLRGVVAAGTPVLGVCLGAQLLARACGERVWRMPDGPEIGWCSVELTDDARDDPVLGRLPARFDAFQWHYYVHALPAGAIELARNDLCTQAFRLGDSAWGVQFHPEVTLGQIESWMQDDEPVPPGLLDETRKRIDGWNELGRSLCDAFVGAAERVAAPA